MAVLAGSLCFSLPLFPAMGPLMQGLHVFDPKTRTVVDLESFIPEDHLLWQVKSRHAVTVTGGSLSHQQSPDQMPSSTSFDSLRRELITVESQCVLVFGVVAPADLKGTSNHDLNLA